MSNPAENHFSRLGLPIVAEMDSETLNSHYFARQRLFHPDTLAGRPAEERRRAVEEAMRLNEAYTTLKHPIRRAEYLLLLQGIRVNTEAGSMKPSPQILIEAMEAREALQEAASLDALKALAAKAEASQQQGFQQFTAYYNAGQMEQAAEQAIRLRYAEKLSEEIKAKRRTYAFT